MYKVNIILFDQFELLDAFGPAEILGKLTDDFELHYCSLEGGLIESAQNSVIKTEKFSLHPDYQNIILIPGGAGTRKLVEDKAFIDFIESSAKPSDYILSVCTGAALLGKTSLLDHKKATSNKRSFDWVTSQNEKVEWIKKARWVKDGHIYTSSGISAGMDMTLGFIKDVLGESLARETANRIEYLWNEDPRLDPFSDLY